jgi:type II restriction enzyme
MPKVDEANEILISLGLPRPNTKAAYTLLALADMHERKGWRSAGGKTKRIHDVIKYIRDVFRVTYAENTREDFRKGVLKPFEQARIVDRNPGNPSLATNSPLTHYALSDAALKVLRAHGSSQFDAEVEAFRRAYGSLSDVYAARKKRLLVPVTLPSGEQLLLSPGKHNELQAAVIATFAPRFAPGANLLYLGDASERTLHVAKGELAKLGIPLTKHGKLPDILLHLPEKNWLLLIEAVTSHGPVSPTRRFELEKALVHCTAERVYVTAFRDFKEFKRHVHDIAWETEVWIAENPDHLIHYNGEKFLGPFVAPEES